MSPFLRKVRTSSGATAVQIAVKEDGVRRIVEHLGSAHNKTELAALLEVGRQKIASRQGQGLLDLGVLPREVVNAVGGGLAVQGGVGSVVIVEVQPCG